MLPVSVTLGGVPLPAANIAFDGLIYCGEVQINILIPAKAPTGGAVPLVASSAPRHPAATLPSPSSEEVMGSQVRRYTDLL
jgi:uncharacterized protein (TIGR03437 family)